MQTKEKIKDEVSDDGNAGFVIPAIDIIDGKCVRLSKGDYTKQKIYHDDPVVIAKQFESAGFKRVHMVDLDGAKSGTIKNLKVLEAVAANTGLTIDFGGGVKTQQDIGNVLNAGASIVCVGSIAAKHPELLEEWLMEFGPDNFLIGADVLDKKIKISGWTEDAGIDVFSFIGKMIANGVHQVFCTDISKDGMLQGPSTELYKEIIETFPELKLIASGGVHNIKDVKLLKEIGCSGAIIGKAIYEETISLDELVKLDAC